jgi:photosystem II stability/assembly factor-like uncharacterized protein
MSFRSFISALLGALLSISAPADAAFKDPLLTAAEFDPALAQSSRLTGVALAGSRLVAVGPRGHVLYSDTEGGSWKAAKVPVSVDLTAVRFVTPKKGWAVGHDGIVLHTADGGQSWTKQFDGHQAVELLQSTMQARANAGDEAAKALLPDVVRLVEEGPGKPFLDVLFVNEHEGFVVGAFNLAFHTRDGGNTWEPLLGRIENPRSLHIYALAVSAGKLYAAGEQGLLLAWNADKQRFQALSSPYKGSLFGLVGTDTALVAYGLRGHAFVSNNGGQNWRQREMQGDEAVTGATALPDGSIVLATQGGKLLHDIGSGPLREIKVARPMALSGVAVAGPDKLALVGSTGVQIQPLSAP